jgi:hypothetical protein
MKTAILIVVGLILILICVRIITKRKMPDGLESIDRGQYELLLGCDAKQVFLHYRVTNMHGLSLSGAEQRIAEGGSYIDGLCNYHPRDKNLDKNPLPFLFLNIKSLQNNYSNHEVYTCIMHECMHMAGLMYDGCWDSHEEEMILWAEKEANEIIVLLKKKKFI